MIYQQTNTGVVVKSPSSNPNYLLPTGSINYDQLHPTLQQVLVPTGVVIPYTSTSIPTGYLPCDGSFVSRNSYKSLFNLIGTTFGPGDSSQFSKFTPNMASNSQAGYTTSASTTAGAGFEAFRAFDGVTSGNGWKASAATGFVQVQSPTTQNVTAYSILAIQTGSGLDSTFAPRDWTLQGSNDGVTFFSIDTRAFQQDWFTGEKRYFEVASPQIFSYFRLNITANGGGANVTVGELELYTQQSQSFHVPDFRGRLALGPGTGTGLTTRTLGSKLGVETVTLTATQIPAHTHGWSVTTGNVSADHSHSLSMWYTPVAAFGSVFNALSNPDANFGGNANYGTNGESADHTHGYSTTTDNGTGSNLGHPNIQPSLVTNFAVKY